MRLHISCQLPYDNVQQKALWSKINSIARQVATHKEKKLFQRSNGHND